MIKLKKIPFIDARGTNYEIGFTIGKKLRKQLRETILIEKAEYKKETGKLLTNYAKTIHPLVEITKKYFPHYLEELRGMADGAKIKFDLLFAAGCADEIVYGCTSIAGLSDEGPIVGHNEDWLTNHANSLYICRIWRGKKPQSISLNYIGRLPGYCVGYNAAKLAFTDNYLNCKAKKIGVPWQFLKRGFLDAKKNSDLAKIASFKNKIIGGNSLIVLKNKIFDLEMFPQGYAVLNRKKYLAHTNHIISNNLDKEESREEESVWRLNRANQLLKNEIFDSSLVKKILSDHKNRPFSLCCHEYEKKGAVPFMTLASVIIKPKNGEFWVAHGNPCHSRYRKFTL